MAKSKTQNSKIPEFQTSKEVIDFLFEHLDDSLTDNEKQALYNFMIDLSVMAEKYGKLCDLMKFHEDVYRA